MRLTRAITWFLVGFSISLLMMKLSFGQSIAPPECKHIITDCPIIEWTELEFPFVYVIHDCNEDGIGDKECIYYVSPDGFKTIECKDNEV